jgi:hypothetical protein
MLMVRLSFDGQKRRPGVQDQLAGTPLRRLGQAQSTIQATPCCTVTFCTDNVSLYEMSDVTVTLQLQLILTQSTAVRSDCTVLRT